MGADPMTLTDFLLARIAEDEEYVASALRPRTVLAGRPGSVPRVLAECEAKRRIVEWHKSWPVLAQTPPKFEQIDSADPSNVAFRASQQMAWLTEQEYRGRFGSEPPTGPMLRLLALPYADHPDYDESWRP